MRGLHLSLSLLFASGLLAQGTQAVPKPDNAKLSEMYAVDQAAREGDHIDWAKLTKEDEQRRQEVRRMLASSEVHTGNDYFHAAMIFQHGQNPDEYLLAHALSMDAVAQGNKDARWLSAATLDRYLLSIWQPQVFGTQFHGGADFGAMTHDRSNPGIVTDSMRASTCVTSAAEQQAMLDAVNHGGTFGSTQLKDKCR